MVKERNLIMKTFLLPALVLVLSGQLSAQNLISNGSFELGTEGFGLRKNLCFDRNPDMKFFPLETVRDPTADGKSVLRLCNPYGERFELHSRQFPLKSDTAYTLRFRAKSTAPGGQKLYFVPYSVSNNWRGWHFSAALTGEWKEYEYKFKTGPKDGTPFSYHLQVRNVSDREIPAGDIFIDNLELFESGSVPAKSVEFAVSVKEPLIESDGRAGVPVLLKTGNFTEKVWKGNVTLKCEEEFFPDLGVSRTLALELRPGEIREIPVELNVGFGSFTISATSEGIGHSIPAAFAVVGRYVPEKLDFDRDFCIAVNGGAGIVRNVKIPYFSMTARNAAPERKLEYLARMGCRMIREHDGGFESTAWSVLEPSRGKWDFFHMDYTLNLFRKYGIEPLNCVGRINFLRPNEQEKQWRIKGWPDWLEPLCHPAEHKPYNWDDVRGRVFLPPLELWREYVRRIVAHAKGRIRYYEVFNEANGGMGAEDYFPYLKALYEEVKKNDPAAKVLGLCVTSDFGVSGDRFTLDVMKSGGGQYMDIATFHPYQGRELNSVNPADRYVANFRKCLGPGYEKNMPVWNTELYYLFDTADKTRQGICTPAHVAARFLTDLGEHVGQSVAVSEGQLWNPGILFPEGAVSSDSWVSLIPNGNFVTYNALARHFEAAKPEAKHLLPNGTVAYLFRKGDSLVAAVWNWQKKQGVKGDFSGLQVFDLYGNPLPTGILPLSGAPYYVHPGGLDDGEFSRKLAELPVSIDNPISAAPFVRILTGKHRDPVLLATLHNDSERGRKIVAGFQGGHFTAAESVSAAIPPRGFTDIRIPLRKGVLNSSPVLRIYFNGRLFDIPVTVRENLSALFDSRIVMEKQDFRAVWFLKRAEGRLLFEITVQDSTHSGSESAGRKPWEQDCVELFIDTAPERLDLSHPYSYTPDTFRIFVMPRLATDKQMEVWMKDNMQFKRSDVTCTVVSGADSYRVTVSFPAGKNAGKMIGFDVKVNDALPGGKTHRELHWTGEKTNHKDRTVFGVMESERRNGK